MLERVAQNIPAADRATSADQTVSTLPSIATKIETYRREKARVIHHTRKIALAEDQAVLKAILELQLGIPIDEEIDVYNSSSEFVLNGVRHKACRVERRSSELDSLTVFFRLRGDQWEPLPAPVFKLQDPSVVVIDGEIVFSGVKLDVAISKIALLSGIDQKVLKSFGTVFLKGKTLGGLRPFAQGPKKMKDIRLVELPNHQIGIYTRPQGSPETRQGQIGFTIINSLSDLNWQVIQNAPLLSARFPNGEWGGVNEAKLLPNGKVFALGHQAHLDSYNHRHYYSTAFIHEPETGQIEDLGILAERSDFPEGPAKRDDLGDVLFSAGVEILDHTEILLKVGMSDAEVGEMDRMIPQVDLKG